MTQEQMIELMARAPYAQSTWAGMDERDRYGARRSAQAVMAAFSEAGMVVVPREATEEMVESGIAVCSYLTFAEDADGAKDIWRAMVAAAEKAQ